MVSKEDVIDVLKTIYDPEIPVNIMDLGLIYGIDVDNGTVKIRMTLTAPGCPMSAFIVDQVKDKVKEIDGVEDVDVELTFDPPWTPERLSEKAKKMLGWEE